MQISGKIGMKLTGRQDADWKRMLRYSRMIKKKR